MSPRRILFASALVAVATTSCGTIDDPDLVASVEGVELTEGEFDDLVRDYTGDEAATEVDGDTAREIVGSFVGVEVLRADLAAMGIEPLDSSELDGFVRLQTDFQLILQEWLSLPAATMLDESAVARYEEGPESSGVVCAAQISVGSEDDADAVVDRLDSDTDLVQLASELTADPGSGANGGILGCFTIEQFRAAQLPPEFVDAALAAEVGQPTDPVESELGWHVIELLPADRISDQDAFLLRLSTFDDRYDIVIDPRFGQWDPSALIVPVV